MKQPFGLYTQTFVAVGNAFECSTNGIEGSSFEFNAVSCFTYPQQEKMQKKERKDPGEDYGQHMK